MDIDLLSKMVGELILDNDEVSLPGVGTFVAEVVPSTFSDKVIPSILRIGGFRSVSASPRTAGWSRFMRDPTVSTSASPRRSWGHIWQS